MFTAFQSLAQRVRRALGRQDVTISATSNVPPATIARQLYREIVAQARLLVFYEVYRVPDTPDGRFDMIALHAALVMHRLRGEPALPPTVSQALFDQMFSSFDESLREMGVGDLRVGKVVKGMAKGFYGRLASYATSLDNNDRGRLEDALRRNVYRHGANDADAVGAVGTLATYVIDQARWLAERDGLQLLRDGLAFPPPQRS